VLFQPNATKIAIEADWNRERIVMVQCRGKPIWLKEHIYSVSVAARIIRNHYLYFIFEEVMQRTIPAGLPLYLWYRGKSFQQRIRLNDTTVYEQPAFTLGNMDYAFFLFLITSLISIIAFICELIVFKLGKLLRGKGMQLSEENNIYTAPISLLGCVENESDSPQDMANDLVEEEVNDDNMSITSEVINDYCIEIAEIHHSNEPRMNENESETDEEHAAEVNENQVRVEVFESCESDDGTITEFEFKYCSSICEQRPPRYASGLTRSSLFSMIDEEGYENEAGMIADTLEYLDN
jgi:hypothetical protein